MNVIRLDSIETQSLTSVLDAYGLELVEIRVRDPIPGSYWGEPEAGLITGRLYARPDTPLHSALHETAHYACMSPRRRARLHADAGGSALEEVAVCFLSVLLADEIPGFGRRRMLRDMDSWGYGFRLGAAERWFEDDADDARRWLLGHGLVTGEPSPTWRLRR
ncbi:MAG: hypothetical protein R3286_00870 [Gammaproteobacteria bacterium]|nr:hypothetical protein [Gammaproteobacteria bacterium]